MNILEQLYQLIWGLPLLLMIVGVSLYFTIALRGIQFTHLIYALKLAFLPEKKTSAEGDISNFQSLMTALAGTIGIGNIAGVATALTVGGQGALFWMWVMAIVGMATKYAEAILSVKYRELDDRGEMCGGPMYFIEKGLGWRWLAVSFAVCGAIAAFGGGNMIQANSVADVMESVFHLDPTWTAITLAFTVGIVLLGGIQAIGRVASILVPVMAIFYIGGGCTILFKCYDKIPHALYSIFTHAFTGQAAFGGFAGSSMYLAFKVGMSRGLMTSEAGLGTASIASAAARTDHPGKQAMVSMTGGFLSTVVLCSVTGLVLGVTDVFGATGANGKLINGASLTVTAFDSVLPGGGYVVAIGLVLFALTTLLGWAYYGEKCLEYLVGSKSTPYYRALFTLVIIPGALLDLEFVWKLSDITNGLMSIPNLIGVAALSGVVVKETKEFLQLVKAEKALLSGKTSLE